MLLLRYLFLRLLGPMQNRGVLVLAAAHIVCSAIVLHIAPIWANWTIIGLQSIWIIWVHKAELGRPSWGRGNGYASIGGDALAGIAMFSLAMTFAAAIIATAVTHSYTCFLPTLVTCAWGLVFAGAKLLAAAQHALASARKKLSDWRLGYRDFRDAAAKSHQQTPKPLQF